MPHPASAAQTHRANFVRAVLAKTAPVAKLCLEYEFSRRVGYKWLERFEEEGWSGLADPLMHRHRA
jgi:putative transposase